MQLLVEPLPKQLDSGFVIPCPLCLSDKVFEITDVFINFRSFYVEVLKLSFCLFFFHHIHKGVCKFIAKGVPEPGVINLHRVNLSGGNVIEPFYLCFLLVCYFQP
jgi:hypothetical protein